MSKKKKKPDPLMPGDLDKALTDQWCGVGFTTLPNGLLLPTSHVEPQHEDIVDLHNAAMAAAMQAYDSNYLDVTHKLNRIIEQQVLRELHKNRMEYVWSDTLQAHVPIGEPP